MSEITKEISSKHNHLIKLTKSLSNRKFRDKEKLFILEGVRLIEEAVYAGINIKFVLYCDKVSSSLRGSRLLEKFKELGIGTFLVEESLFRDLADTENPQGILAVAEVLTSSFSDIKINQESLFLLIDGVQDPGNLGTMIRTACAAGASGVVLTKGTVDLFNPKVIRASMGMVFQIPIIVGEDNQSILEFFKDNGFRLLVADAKGEKLYYHSDAKGPVVWVLGNEANGPGDFFLNEADEIVSIPLLGQVESLNVAVAAGILLFDHVRRRTILVN
ncbi:MAG: TrmH family RNA methyltransferase [Bacillota bacterium]|jgi:TrmH family RNA methyltransferase